MNPTTGRVLGATLAGTILLGALATLSVTTTDSVTSSEPAGGSFSVSQTVAGTQKPAPAQPTPSANQTYTVVPTGSFSIQGSKTSAYDSAIEQGAVSQPDNGRISGYALNNGGDILTGVEVTISPSSISGEFVIAPMAGATEVGGGQLQGHESANGDLVYSGTLHFNNLNNTHPQSVTVAGLTLRPGN